MQETIPRLEGSLGGGNGNLLQYLCLETSMGAWWAIVHRVAKSQKCLRGHTHTHTYTCTRNELLFALINPLYAVLSHSVVSNSLQHHGL